MVSKSTSSWTAPTHTQPTQTVSLIIHHDSLWHKNSISWKLTWKITSSIWPHLIFSSSFWTSGSCEQTWSDLSQLKWAPHIIVIRLFFRPHLPLSWPRTPNYLSSKFVLWSEVCLEWICPNNQLQKWSGGPKPSSRRLPSQNRKKRLSNVARKWAEPIVYISPWWIPRIISVRSDHW